MSWIPDRYRELRSQLRSDSIEDDVDEELRLHLELRTADFERAGMGAAAAREEVLRRFGDVSAFRDQTCEIEQDIRRERRRMEITDAVRREVRHALRSLARAPMFTAVAVLTLALGIGATTAIFTLIDSIVFRPLPYPAQDRLVQLGHGAPRVSEGEWGNSVASYFFYLDNNHSLEEMGAYQTMTYTVTAGGDAERVDGARVSASLLRVLGAEPVHGRLINEEDDVPGAERVALLSHEIWMSRFGGDPAVVGRTVDLSSFPYTVIGVLAPGFRLPGHDTRMWTSFQQLDRSLEPVNWHYVQAYARLRPGTSVESATGDIQRLTDRLPEVFPGPYDMGFMESSGFHASVTLVRSRLLGSIDRVLWMVFGAVGLVLLIACANVGNLMLVRTEARRREFSLRAALGAERAHLAVHYLTESLLLTIAASVLGAALAFAGVKLLVAMAPATVPRLDEIAVGWRALGFALALALSTGVVFGLVPLIRKHDDFGELRDGGRGATSSRERQFVRRTLVIGQVAMALVLLAGGALMLQSLVNLRNVRSGIDPTNVLVFQAFTPYSRYDHDDMVRFQRELSDRLRAVPGVMHVGGTTRVPLAPTGLNCSYTVAEGREITSDDGACLPTIHVLPGYLASMGITILAGRELTWSDVEQRTGAAVISRTLADRLWPDENPIGKGIITYQDGPPWYRIVGVADHVRSEGLDKAPVEAVYYPTTAMTGASVTGHPFPDIFYTVRTAGVDAGSLAPSLQQVLRSMDPAIPLAGAQIMTDVIARSGQVARISFMMLLLGISAVMALFLSAVGLYGVIAYLVGRRQAEIGVRMALGARVGQVIRLIMAQSVMLAAAGIAIGVVAALATTRVLESLLFEVQPGDPTVLLLVSMILLLVSLLASLVPARRAARTDPSEALRAD
jgi:predicted permease